MKHLLRATLWIAAATFPATFAAAETPLDRTAHPYIRTTGDATVSAKPDRAKLAIGVVTQAAGAQAAAKRNATDTATMLANLRHALGAGAEIRTSGYSLTPTYTNPRNGDQSVLSGYTASNTVEVTTDDLANVGKVIDAGAAAGANNVRGLDFLLKDEAPVHAQALREAALKARASAEAVAAALGLKVVRVLSAEEGEPQVIRPMRMMAMAPGASAATPIESGNIQIQATVTLTVEVAP
jgi:uncharacterized protein YggE